MLPQIQQAFFGASLLSSHPGRDISNSVQAEERSRGSLKYHREKINIFPVQRRGIFSALPTSWDTKACLY